MERTDMSTLFHTIPATEGVRRIGFGEGEEFDIAGAHLTWKAKGENTGYAFSICEPISRGDELGGSNRGATQLLLRAG